jgi:hypothetical protein
MFQLFQQMITIQKIGQNVFSLDCIEIESDLFSVVLYYEITLNFILNWLYIYLSLF